LSIDQILEAVAQHEALHVTVTGGEPLAQKGCLELLSALCDTGYQVSLETSGALDVAPVDGRVVKVLDLKTPASGEMNKNLYSNLDHLRPGDQLKFVICDQPDYQWARDQVVRRRLERRCAVLFSPAAGELPANRLAQWILQDRLPVRLQIQLHKYLWGDQPGR
jgi:7-carboxy-7-deazaguanine synthase